MMKHNLIITLALLMTITIFSCGSRNMEDNPAKLLDKAAKNYVMLVHEAGRYDKNLVDAWFGPPEVLKEALAENLSLAAIKLKIDSLTLDLAKIDAGTGELARRKVHLSALAASLSARVDFLLGKKMTFREEAKLVYGVDIKFHNNKYYDNILKDIDKLLPGKGDLTARMVKFREQFIIPREKLDTVFRAAVAEGKKRAKSMLTLPDKENFVINYVKGVPWGAYNWFKGNAFSMIEVNTDLPIYIERAVDLACHEGYPGHHVFHSSVENNLVNGKNWIEYSIYPLFSPISFISEGLANYGINLAFPGNERIEFEKKVLFPLAGLDTSKAELYYKVLHLAAELSFSQNESAAAYLDGKLSREETIARMMKYELKSRERAEKSIKFIETYRAYVLNYTLGEKQISDYIDSRAGKHPTPEAKWKIFGELVRYPLFPSELK